MRIFELITENSLKPYFLHSPEVAGDPDTDSFELLDSVDESDLTVKLYHFGQFFSKKLMSKLWIIEKSFLIFFKICFKTLVSLEDFPYFSKEIF